MSTIRVCPACARRTWLLERLAGHLDPVRGRIDELLALEDLPLVQAVGGERRDAIARELAGHDPAELGRRVERVERVERAELDAICRCDPAYPEALRDLPAPPAVLYVAGGLRRLAALRGPPCVALVGSRRPSAYGTEIARTLAADLACAGLPVVSGMALGIDAAAHRGALDAHLSAGAGASRPGPDAPGPTVAVLPAGPDIAYPARHRRLLTHIRQRGVVLSELGPGVAPRRWMFPARNRIIAALAQLTVIVQARERSGALITAGWAARLGRLRGAVPGPATAPLSAGPHQLLREGAALIASVQDVLDALYGAGAVRAPPLRQSELEPALAALLEAVADGEEGASAFARAGLNGECGLAALARLELAGLVRRGPGGRYVARSGRR
ncbi:MAG TPA: DNA-processing protein DprA [Solirubrobacteraceae bacterium]|nr:DNA-processing protein DprA [Solirubrobacteraceae bacterium]